MEQIIKYKTSDAVEWDSREAAEEHEKYLNIKAQIRNHREQIHELEKSVDKFQKNCSHKVQSTPQERRTSRSGDTDGYDRYSIPVLETTFHCKICNKSWITKRDL